MLQAIKNVRVEHFDGDRTKITGECRATGVEYSLWVSTADFHRWQSGELIQRAMPYLNADDREFLISGTTPMEWERLFGNEEDIERRENPVDRKIREES